MIPIRSPAEIDCIRAASTIVHSVQIALEAAMRDRQWAVARALLAERLRLRETAPHAFTTQVEGRLKRV